MNRRFGGLLAKRTGDRFEKIIEIKSRTEGLTYVRIPDGCKQITANRLIRVPTPFDCIIGMGPAIVFCDLKSTGENKISMADSIVKPHQKQALSNLSKHQRAGILVNFQLHEAMVFFDASLLYGKPLGVMDGKRIEKLRELFE